MTESIIRKGMFIRPELVPPSAWLGHIPFAGWAVDALRPRLFVELGTHAGASYLAFCQAVSWCVTSTRCYAVDTWEGDEHSMRYGDEVFATLAAQHDARYADFSQLMRMTFDEASAAFADGSVDLLHIDGLHTYEAVRHDFETWLPKLSDRGVVLFHDTMGRHDDFGVWRLWEELSPRYPSIQFTHSHGLGAIAVGSNPPDAFLDLVEQGRHAPHVVGIFAALGAGIQVRHEASWWKGEALRYGVEATALRERFQSDGDGSEARDVVAILEHAREAARNLLDEDDASMHERNARLDALMQHAAQANADAAAAHVRAAEADLRAIEAQAAVAAADARACSAETAASDRIVAADAARARAMMELEDLRGVMAQTEAELAIQLEHVATGLKSHAAAMAAVSAQASQIDELTTQLRHRERFVQQLLGRNGTLATALTMPGHRIGRRVEDLRVRFVPEGSRRFALARLGWRFLRKWRDEGLVGALRAAAAHLQRRARTSSIEGPHGIALHPKAVDADHPNLASYILANEPTADALASQRERWRQSPRAPLISVIVPVYKVPRDVLEATIASMEAQTYERWEACLAWADIEDEAGWAWLQQRAARDRRLHAFRLEENGGISRNSNRALERARGEFIALLDHDDTLTPWAFHAVADVIERHPDADFLYTDKDSISGDGRRRMNALFKPDWSPEMMHSVNYLTHLNVMRTSLVHEVGGWNPDTDGAQDWDIFFRITERAARIERVPTIAYHWRILPTSTSTGLQAKPYAAIGQLRAQEQAFRRRGLAASVVPTPEGLFDVQWPTESNAYDIIVSQTAGPDELIATLSVIASMDHEGLGRILVAAKPEDRVKIEVAVRDLLPAAVVVEGSGGWRHAVDQALQHLESRCLVLLDGRITTMIHGTLPQLAGWCLHHPDIAWTTAVAVNRDDVVIETGRVVGAGHRSAPLLRGAHVYSFGWFGGALWYRNVRAASPYAFAIRRETLVRHLGEVGDGLEGFTALCLAATAGGLRGLVNPHARIQLGLDPEPDWSEVDGEFASDPYFNPAFARVSPLTLKS